MITALTTYELICYWNCSKGYSILTKGTLNQIIQWREKNNCITDENIKLQYGNGAYTITLPSNS